MSSIPQRTLGRNDPCHCGSGRKYKQCCLDKDEASARQQRAQVAEAAGAAADAEPAKASAQPRPKSHQPWKASGPKNTRGFHNKVSTPRKVGGGG